MSLAGCPGLHGGVTRMVPKIPFGACAAAAALLGALGAVPPASAVLPETSLERMVEASDAIVLGEVTDARAAMLGREVVTLFTVEVDETLKGEPRDAMTLMLPGGMVPRAPVPIARVAADVPRLAVGDGGMWFLTEAPGAMALTSAKWGFMPIVEGPAGEELVAVQSIPGGGAGVGLVDLMRETPSPPTPPRPESGPGSGTPGIPLERMMARVLDLLR